jgi:hypothetical protein
VAGDTHTGIVAVWTVVRVTGLAFNDVLVIKSHGRPLDGIDMTHDTRTGIVAIWVIF